MLEFVKGDLFDISADIRVNTVNCVGAMGAGVALAFRTRYPEMFKDYKRACKNGEVRPGRMHVWKSLGDEWVINFPTKRDWRDPSRYEDIDAGLDDLRDYLDRVGPVSVALPALGCGNGGLDWNRVSSMISEKLSGVDAHIFVFEPAASMRAGKQSASTTHGERAHAEELGYTLVKPDGGNGIGEPAYILGRIDALSRNWIALLPSRSPSEREMQALRSIAAEVRNSKLDVAIALIHGAKVSEQIADIFIQNGVDTVLLLPFGVLTRKALASSAQTKREARLTLASTAPPHANWSRQIFAQTVDWLRENASAILLSDPEPEWLTTRGLDKWSRKAIAFVKYEATSPATRKALGDSGAVTIGRRGDTGAPNIEYLLDPFRRGSKDNANGIVSESASLLNERPTEEDVLAVRLDEFTDDQKRSLFESLCEMDLRAATLILKLPQEGRDDKRRQLELLGFTAK